MSKNLTWSKTVGKLSGVKQPRDNDEMTEARDKILELGNAFMEARGANVPKIGVDPIPASSKYLDKQDLNVLLDASLDLWLTEGRYADAFSDALKNYIGIDGVALTVSGSSANLLAFTALTSNLLGDRRVEAGSEVIALVQAFLQPYFQ